ncbi:MAG TPA: DMT family transporter [Falsiroseomonas sp.]|jgi:drug/metabolite transporter (DMT)-like permease|nr:DMT family transporter [Falsiroseomonas sp.]
MGTTWTAGARLLRPTDRLGSAYAMLVLAGVFWGSNLIAGRALAEHAPPAMLNFLRWSVALAVLLPLAWPRMRDQWIVVRQHLPQILILGTLGITAFNSLLYAGLSQVPAMNVGIISGMSPATTVAIAVLAGQERLPPRRAAGVLLAVAGALVVITRGDPGLLQSLALGSGEALVVASVLCGSSYTVLLRRFAVPLPPIGLLAAMCLVGVAESAPLAAWELAATGRQVAWSWEVALLVAYVGLLPSVGSMLLFNIGVARVGAGTAGLFITFIPISAAALAVVLLGEPLRWFHALGLALVLSGVVASLVGRAVTTTPRAVVSLAWRRE